MIINNIDYNTDSSAKKKKYILFKNFQIFSLASTGLLSAVQKIASRKAWLYTRIALRALKDLLQRCVGEGWLQWIVKNHNFYVLDT